MTCLETILDTLATQPGCVEVRLSTLQARAVAELNAQRPDLTLRKQIDHWAAAHGLVACFERQTRMIRFERIHPHSIP